jgi:hypothetical protein
MNGGIINFFTRLHLVGYFSWDSYNGYTFKEFEDNSWFQISVVKQIRYVLFWYIMEHYGGNHTLCNNTEEHRANKAVHTMKAHMWSTGITPLILNLGTGWMSSHFTPWLLLYLWQKTNTPLPPSTHWIKTSSKSNIHSPKWKQNRSGLNLLVYIWGGGGGKGGGMGVVVVVWPRQHLISLLIL